MEKVESNTSAEYQPKIQKSAYTIQFWLLCLCSFLFMAGHYMILPELPAYLSSLGGGDYKGYIIGLFTITAAISRPYSGRLADKIGRIPVIIIGTGVCCVCALFYPFVGSVAAFLLLRLVHGFSMGFQPTGTSAYVADIAPENRRGEAIGLFGLLGSIGIAFGPVIGSAIAQQFSVNIMFYLSSACSLVSVLLLSKMRETVTEPVPFSFSLLKIKANELLEPLVWVPAIILFLIMFPNGMVLTLIPDFSTYLGLTNKGIYFTFFTSASLATRFFAGRASDKYGRVPILRCSLLILILAMIVTALATSPVLLIVAAILYGITSGISSPTLYAWTVDLSRDQQRGRAMATAYFAVEAGVGIGALLAGWTFANQTKNISSVFWLASLFGLVAFLFLMMVGKKHQLK
ncbi:MFS transporter [Adhaeribacter radiodurans]|uniref:MFS transporter n=1 Tax=Adhaeribacter radiodurans TaxID=2745197 RepID=A0A7L7L9S1_9BACT|nr:MFS transporter [Adhaeribacter radiodurans]QMU29139.1 MFS transporter [Adhaeribacter radiodurans]